MATRKILTCLMTLAAAATLPTVLAGPCGGNVNRPDRLAECVALESVREHQLALQAIADANGGTRVAGFGGDADSVGYVAGMLEDAGYDVTVQAFSFLQWFRLGPSSLAQTVPGTVAYAENVDFRPLRHSDSGDVTGAVTAVDLDPGLGNSSTSGCDASDFAGFTPGHIALMQRGSCTFARKAELAASAGAVGAIIMNQGDEETPERREVFDATLTSPYGGRIPVVAVSYDRGVEWATTGGLTMRLIANVFRDTVVSANVIAETAGGRADNVVMAGAHLDSVYEGPGIQGNGSGSAALLEIAIQMRNVNPSNKVRFAWWGAEEPDRVGSAEYLAGLTAPELDDIALYLNFDMIGSPNFVRFVYDGDASTPPGSGAIEALFTDYFSSRGLPSSPTEAWGRTTTSLFLRESIPIGGLFTGAEGIKSPEEAAIYGGIAGQQYDPCYQLACDTSDNISLEALDVSSDAAAFAIMSLARSTETVNGVRGRGPRPGRRGGPGSSEPIGVLMPE